MQASPVREAANAMEDAIEEDLPPAPPRPLSDSRATDGRQHRAAGDQVRVRTVRSDSEDDFILSDGPEGTPRPASPRLTHYHGSPDPGSPDEPAEQLDPVVVFAPALFEELLEPHAPRRQRCRLAYNPESLLTRPLLLHDPTRAPHAAAASARRLVEALLGGEAHMLPPWPCAVQQAPDAWQEALDEDDDGFWDAVDQAAATAAAAAAPAAGASALAVAPAAAVLPATSCVPLPQPVPVPASTCALDTASDDDFDWGAVDALAAAHAAAPAAHDPPQPTGCTSASAWQAQPTSNVHAQAVQGCAALARGAPSADRRGQPPPFGCGEEQMQRGPSAGHAHQLPLGSSVAPVAASGSKRRQGQAVLDPLRPRSAYELLLESAPSQVGSAATQQCRGNAGLSYSADAEQQYRGNAGQRHGDSAEDADCGGDGMCGVVEESSSRPCLALAPQEYTAATPEAQDAEVVVEEEDLDLEMQTFGGHFACEAACAVPVVLDPPLPGPNADARTTPSDKNVHADDEASQLSESLSAPDSTQGAVNEVGSPSRTPRWLLARRLM